MALERSLGSLVCHKRKRSAQASLVSGRETPGQAEHFVKCYSVARHVWPPHFMNLSLL
jgi:hypothetical protein